MKCDQCQKDVPFTALTAIRGKHVMMRENHEGRPTPPRKRPFDACPECYMQHLVSDELPLEGKS